MENWAVTILLLLSLIQLETSLGRVSGMENLTRNSQELNVHPGEYDDCMIYGLDPLGNDIPWTFAYEISQEDCYDSCKRESNCLLVLYRTNSRSCFPST